MQRTAPQATGAAQTQTQSSSDSHRPATLLQAIAKEEVIVIESQDVELEIGTTSGAVRRAALNKFRSSSGDSTLRFGNSVALLSLQVSSEDTQWNLVNSTPTSATFNVIDQSGKNYHILYMLDNSNPILRTEISSVDAAQFPIDVSLISSWSRADALNGRNNALEAILLTERDGGKTKSERHMAPWKKEKIVPRGTLLATLSERYFCSSLKPSSGTLAVTLIPSDEGTAAFSARATLLPESGGRISYAAELYLGPRDYFYLNRAKFSQAIPVGAIGQIGLIFLMFLSWIGKLTGNYGIAIILFSCLVSCATAPFTLVSLKSMKKMQELKPQIDRLMAAHKGDSTRANKEVFALYKQHRVNPLSGCLPMLLQMPIFIALFQAISHFIELRGQPFLWIRDLSLPDRLAKLPVTLPIIGGDLNLLPLIMAAAMYLQTKISQGKMPADQTNPAAKMMSGPTMSIVFGIMFYQFQSGLVLYWLTNSLMSMALYRLVK
jgi:YidC/Oxa1 family membrane protein insertase